MLQQSQNVFTPYAAWSLQTPQGAEVSIKLIIDTPTDVTSLSSASSALTSGISSMNIDTTTFSLDGNNAQISSGDIGTSNHSQPTTVHLWTGRVVVRCSDNATLQAVLADMEYLIYALSGGYMGMSHQV